MVREKETNVDGVYSFPTLDKLRQSIGSVPCIEEPICVCIDTESDERNNSVTIEVGISIFDCRDVIDLPHGDRGHAWFQHISYAHFRVSEHYKIKNRRFCPGDPEGFLFAKSQFFAEAEIGAAINKHIDAAAMRHLKKGEERRNIAVIGHAINNDEPKMRELQVTWPPVGHVATIDTQRVAGMILDSNISRRAKLEVILECLGIHFTSLHNGGNDAAFQLQKAIALAVLTQDQLTAILGRCNLEPKLPQSWPEVTIEQETAPPPPDVEYGVLIKVKRPQTQSKRESKGKKNENAGANTANKIGTDTGADKWANNRVSTRANTRATRASTRANTRADTGADPDRPWNTMNDLNWGE